MFENEIEELGRLYRMPNNWGGRGENTIGFRALMRAMQMVTTVYCEFGKKPYLIFPTINGGLTIEYRNEGEEIEIEIYDDREDFAYLIDLGPEAHPDGRYLIEDEVPYEKITYLLARILEPTEDSDYV
jgi:hypothetical protein